jgi:membrane protein YdbS with pleckstrin-like domain
MTTAALMEELFSTAWSVITAVLPLVVLFMIFQIFVLGLPRGDVRNILVGTLLAGTGLFFFLVGVTIGLMPFGRAVGDTIGSVSQKWLLLPAGLVLGFVTTWGEPAVRILADQVDNASNGSIRRSLVLYAICIGVSLSGGLGLLRIGYEIPLLYLLVPGYVLVLVVMWLSNRDFVAIAVDSGGVATGPLANTFLLSLALGVSSSMGQQNPIVHGLGLVALVALAPILSVMTLGLLMRWKEVRQKSDKGAMQC